MKYFKNINNDVYAYESDGSQDAFIKPNIIPITEQEKDILLAPTPQQLLEIQINQAKAYLQETDFYYARKMETGEDVPLEVVNKRIENRNFLKNNGY